ncbi:Gfo/Idh/MocA family oxidoreductase [Rathayibacter sp. VKM Ac-2929]|uniref:Gfo/Idh/MocA family oxidoreductase n=1 Tax=Rathayibacter sp. VKM Ac-2929 TaxID=2929480 RepID=UPI001FB4D893|nr:Gfo/Idh/MocA family oxidoreductase [Rathayibacter sp. VKM Ac-2929]MCJ1675551.1 Gfo/Idh/MocA family oxidoreductase [Rathayibacter sp. VKM Ac-2929]
MRQNPRVVIVGTGMIGVAHLRAARRAGADVLGVLGSSPARSAAVAAEWGVPRGYADLDEVLADRPDVVHVCTPNDTHVPYGVRIARAGIHLVLEKPIATSVEDAEQLVAAVEEAGVIAAVPFVYRYHPMVREIRARRIAGELGEVLLVHGSYQQDWLASPDASSWRVDPEKGGPSRAFADIGSHWADLAAFVSGEELTDASASFSTAYPTRPSGTAESFGGAATGEHVPVRTEDIAVATFRTARGLVANTVVSQVSAGRKNRLWLEIDGSAGSAVFDQEHPESAWFGGTGGSTVVHRGEGRVSADQARMNLIAAGHSQGWTDAFAQLIADAYAATRGEAPEGLPTVHDGLRSVRVVDAVLRSSRSAAWTAIGADAPQHEAIAEAPVAVRPRASGEGTESVQHTVAFSLVHAPGSPEEDFFLVDARRILAAIPGVQDFTVARQVSPKSDLTWHFSMLFADRAAYAAYNEHPNHVAFVRDHWATEVVDFQELDFERRYAHDG